MSALLVESHGALVAARRQAVPSAVVMTMGALHEGHATLIREARALHSRMARSGDHYAR